MSCYLLAAEQRPRRTATQRKIRRSMTRAGGLDIVCVWRRAPLKIQATYSFTVVCVVYGKFFYATAGWCKKSGHFGYSQGRGRKRGGWARGTVGRGGKRECRKNSPKMQSVSWGRLWRLSLTIHFKKPHFCRRLYASILNRSKIIKL